VKFTWLHIAVALIFSASSLPAAYAASVVPEKPQNASISLGAEFASGNYGTGTTTRSLYMPVIATWSPNERFDLGIEIPYLYQSSSQVTTSLFNTNQTTTAAKSTFRGGPGGNSGIMTGPQTGSSSASTASSSTSVSGLGDIIMRLGIIALSEDGAIPRLRPSVFVKFPTASKGDGLGTGEFDAGGGLDATTWLGDLHLTGEVLYTYQGKVDGFNLKNYLSYTAGMGYQLTRDLEPMLIIKGATAPSSYSEHLLEARARVFWTVTDSFALDLYGSRGISDSSPEYGAGISAIYAF